MFQRKKFIINPYFQLKYLGIVLALVVVVLLVAVYFVTLTIRTTPVLENLTDLEVITVNRLVFRTVLYVCIIFAILIIVLGIFVTHRIAGPLYVFNKMFNLVSEGDLTVQVRLRKGDELQNLALSFQNMVDRLNMYIKMDKQKVEDVKNAIDTLVEMVKQEKPKDVIIQKLLEIKNMLEKLYQNFKI